MLITYISLFIYRSLGILTYVLLTGHTPFGGDTKQDTYCNITLGELDFPQDLFKDVTSEAIHFITQLVVKDPKLVSLNFFCFYVHRSI